LPRIRPGGQGSAEKEKEEGHPEEKAGCKWAGFHQGRDNPARAREVYSRRLLPGQVGVAGTWERYAGTTRKALFRGDPVRRGKIRGWLLISFRFLERAGRVGKRKKNRMKSFNSQYWEGREHFHRYYKGGNFREQKEGGV